MTQVFKVVREPTSVPADPEREKYTLGVMYRNGLQFCQTCEDEDRLLETNPDAKIKGLSAIPRGRYKLTTSYSHHFGKVLPEVLGVPNFTGVRLHGGNHAEHSQGCILTGRVRIRDGIAQCPDTVAAIIELIDDAEERGEESFLEVV